MPKTKWMRPEAVDAYFRQRAVTWPRVTGKGESLPYPHYNETCWDAPAGRPIYGDPADELGAGFSYDYDDRLVQWDSDKHLRAVEAAKASGRANRSVSWWEEYLTSYYGEPREIALVMAGVNPGNGYPWFAFAHRKVEAEA